MLTVMRLPVMPPVAPMLAKAAKQLPVGDGILYEPKWDGFRAIIFRDGDEVETVAGTTPLTATYEVVARDTELPPRWFAGEM